jgi:hypothetical protein
MTTNDTISQDCVSYIQAPHILWMTSPLAITKYWCSHSITRNLLFKNESTSYIWCQRPIVTASMDVLVQWFCFYLYHFNCNRCLNSAFIWTYKPLLAFHQRSPEIEVTLLWPWLHSTIWCFDTQWLYVFIFTPNDGATEHQNMSGWKLISFTKIFIVTWAGVLCLYAILLHAKFFL